MQQIFPITGDIIRALGWALLHSVWQALIIFTCLQVVLKIWPMASAKIKHNLAYTSLLGIFAWFVYTLVQQIQSIQKITYQNIVIAILPDQLPANGQVGPVELTATQQIQTWIPGIEAYFPFLVGFYLLGMLVMFVKMSVDLLQIKQLKNNYILHLEPALAEQLAAVISKVSLPKKVKVRISEKIQVPMMVGCLKPIILLPLAMLTKLQSSQLEALILHELAHIKRNDYILNIFQSIIETILFFNPFVRWISNYIRTEREHCCDDIVVNSNVKPLHYAKALVVLEENRLPGNLLAMAAAGNQQHLFHRIKRIMEMKTKQLNYTQRLLALTIVATGLVSIAWLTPTIKAKAGGMKHDSQNKTTAIAEESPTVTDTTGKDQDDLEEIVVVGRPMNGDTVPGNRKRVDSVRVYRFGGSWGEKQKADSAIAISRKKVEEGLAAAQSALEKIKWEEMEQSLKDSEKQNMKEMELQVQEAMKQLEIAKEQHQISEAEFKKAQQQIFTFRPGRNMNFNYNFTSDSIMFNKDAKLFNNSLKSFQFKGDSVFVVTNVDSNEPIVVRGYSVNDSALRAVTVRGYATARASAERSRAKAQREMERARVMMMDAQDKARLNKARAQQQYALAIAKTRNAQDNAIRVYATRSGKRDNVEGFVNELDRRGFIDKNDNYTISLKKGNLFINGTKHNELIDICNRYLDADQVHIKKKGNSSSTSISKKSN